MNRQYRIRLLAACIAVSAFVSGAAYGRARDHFVTAGPLAFRTGGSAAVAHVMRSYHGNLQRADSAFRALAARAELHDAPATRAAFLQARVAYKRVEWVAEHYTPLTAAALNGPPVDKPDEENVRVIVRPAGLQVIEGMLYARGSDTVMLDSVAIQARMALVNLRRLEERAGETVVSESQLFDAARLELARVTSLGISGWDTPFARSALPEAAAAIESVAGAMLEFAPASGAADSLRRTARDALSSLAATGDFTTFDHYAFITRYATPLSRQLDALQRAAGVPRLTDRRAWRASANTLFDSGAFDPQAFAPPGAPEVRPALLALGARLFHEPRLSGKGDRSCATCHVPAEAFADGRRVPVLISRSNDALPAPVRNTPTLLNAALQATAFADGRVAFLEDQITAVVNNPREMGGNVDQAAARLAEDPSYRPMFVSAFGRVPEREALGRDLRSALAAYLRSLTRLDSRFDLAMRGDDIVLTESERNGFNVFMGKGRCGTCHFAPLFSGTTPPGYGESEVEVIGVPAGTARRPLLDADLGVAMADKASLHEGAFKTPSLRNAAVTAPYMHNGVFRTLAQVIDFYDAGGGTGMGLRVPNQTLSPDSLHLTAQEKRDVIAFIGALTDTGTTGRRGR